MQGKIGIALIYGSAREGRFCDTVAGWAESEINAHGGFDIDVLDPADSGIAAAISGRDDAAKKALKLRLGRAGAFVVVAPEYNHSFAAPLKALIDSAKAEWEAKPVAFVSYGGISGGLRAVEHLRNVFAELHAVGIRDGVSFANAWNLFDQEGKLIDREAPAEAMAIMLDRLQWWALALGNARSEQPYRKAAA